MLYVYKPSQMWAMHTPYKLFNFSWTVFGCSCKRSTIPSKEPPAKFSGYVPVVIAC